MWRGALAMVVGLIMTGPAGAGSLPCQLSLATVLPLTMEPNSGIYSTEAKIDGRPITLYVDTGDPVTRLPRSAVPDTSRLFARGEAVGVEGKGVSQERGTVSGFQLGRLHADIIADVYSGGKIAHGLLGMSTIGQYDIDFDIPDRELRLFTASGECSHPTVLLHGNLFPVAEVTAGSESMAMRVLIPVTVGGKTFTAVVDTGSAVSSIGLDAAHAIGVSDTMLARDRHVGMMMVGGRTAVPVHQFSQMDIGDLVFQNPRLLVTKLVGTRDAQVLLGEDFLRNAHLWISHSSNTVVFQVPAAPSPPLPKGAG